MIAHALIVLGCIVGVYVIGFIAGAIAEIFSQFAVTFAM
jgi:hypothetical protein